MRYEDDEIFFLFFCSKYFTVTLSGLAWGCDNKLYLMLAINYACHNAYTLIERREEVQWQILL